MTIALSIKVNDGVVLATDSAASILQQLPSGNDGLSVVKIYQNAEKLFHLSKELPIGAITWGSGSIGKSSISTLMKDFRKDIDHQVDGKPHTIEGISKKLATFILKDKYEAAYGNWKQKPNIGFLVAGYSEGQDFAEEWKFDIQNGQITGPQLIRGIDESGMIWNGEPEAITRLIKGVSSFTNEVLTKDLSLSEKEASRIQQVLEKKLEIQFIAPPMPIKDAIEMAEFFVDTTIKFSKYKPGAETVGGPIDIASITKHEGFKWIKRKYYYQRELNPV